MRFFFVCFSLDRKKKGRRHGVCALVSFFILLGSLVTRGEREYTERAFGFLAIEEGRGPEVRKGKGFTLLCLKSRSRTLGKKGVGLKELETLVSPLASLKFHPWPN